MTSSPDAIRTELSARLGYASNSLVRHSELRDDAEAARTALDDPAARTIALSGDVPLLRRGEKGPSAYFTFTSLAKIGEVRERVWLGRLPDGSPLFATLYDAKVGEDAKACGALIVTDLRSIAVQGLLPPDELGPVAEAKALMHWHTRHRFCANCGGPTTSLSSGFRRDCAGCGATHFPRTDPVVIMLAVRGERCLMGRQPKFPPGMYSCLAGFVEPGETIEDAVRRETLEEAGVACGDVRYLASQPWPFPSSLMIGCIAEALGDNIVVDHTELEDARWFSRDDVIAILEKRHPDGYICPPPVAIAHHLMKAWALG